MLLGIFDRFADVLVRMPHELEPDERPQMAVFQVYLGDRAKYRYVVAGSNCLD